MTATRDFSRVQGLVFARETDHQGRITAIGLRTRQGEEYLVIATPLSGFLRDFLNTEVLASVEFVLSDFQGPRIRVYGFEPIVSEDGRKGNR